MSLAQITRAPAVHAPEPGALGNPRITGQDGTGVAERAEILGWIEAERGRVSERADRSTVVLRAVGLGAVFQDLQAVASRSLPDAVHVGRVAVEVHDQDRLCVWRDAAVDLARVKRVRRGVDVAEHRPSAGCHNRGHRRYAGVGGHQHLVAALDAECLEADTQRVRSRADSHRLEV